MCKTDKRSARKALGMSPADVADLKLHSEGQECDTWLLILARNVPGWGRKGSAHLFPVPHKGVSNG